MRRYHSEQEISPTLSEWIQHARRYVATGDQQHLDRAITVCTDTEVVTFLRNPDLQARRQVNPSHFEALVDRLIADDRRAEACVVNLLGFRFVASAMFELETYDAERRGFIERTCTALARQCASLGFPECEALFTGLWATGAAKLRRDAESFGLFDGAIRQARSLVEDDADLHSHLLAGLLSNYGNALRVAGKTREAASALKESVDIRRRLAQQTSDRYRAALASTLSNLAAVYAAERRYRDAEPLLTEAIAIQHDLKDAGTTKERRSLAGTLSNLALLYTEQRRFHAARQVSEEALRIRRELAATESEAHLPDVAATLSNLGMLLDDLREYGAAVAHLQEAVAIRRRLAEDQPTVFEADLATSLNNLANSLLMTSESHDIHSAFAAYNEALEIRRRLARCNEAIYEPAVAQTLGNIAGLRRTAGQVDIAIAQFREVATILRKLCDDDPEGYLPQLAGCLNNLGSTLFLAGDAAAAREILAEAATLFKQLASKEPEVYEGEVAGALNDLSLTLSELGLHDQALETAENAIGFAERAETHLHLSKGDVSGAYWLIITDRVQRGSAEEVYDALSALRDPHAQLGEHSSMCRLAEIRRELLDVEQVCGKPIRLVIIEKLSGDNVLFGVLSAEGNDGLQYACVSSFAAKARSLLSLVFEPFADRHAQGSEVQEPQVVDAGELVWRALPGFIRETLHPKADHIVVLSGDPDSLDLPWEALRFGPGKSDWLGLQRHLARIQNPSAPAIHGLRPLNCGHEPRSAAIICPWNVPNQPVLDGAREEVIEVSELLTRAGYSLLPEGRPLMDQWANVETVQRVLSSSPTVVHFAGHGDIVRNERGLVLWGETTTHQDHALFDRRSLIEARIASGRERLFSSKPIVVLNACWAGRSRAFGGQREDLVATFIDEGATCVIAWPTPVHDNVGRLLATLVYVPQIRDQRGLAFTFCRVRGLVERKLRGTAYWWTWLWLRYHGNPFAQMPYSASEADSHSAEDGDGCRSRALDLVRELIA